MRLHHFQNKNESNDHIAKRILTKQGLRLENPDMGIVNEVIIAKRILTKQGLRRHPHSKLSN
ncbi:MAG: hypothetical protein ACRCVG_08315 [Methanobacteriaceae archaeon]